MSPPESNRACSVAATLPRSRSGCTRCCCCRRRPLAQAAHGHTPPHSCMFFLFYEARVSGTPSLPPPPASSLLHPAPLQVVASPSTQASPAWQDCMARLHAAGLVLHVHQHTSPAGGRTALLPALATLTFQLPWSLPAHSIACVCKWIEPSPAVLATSACTPSTACAPTMPCPACLAVTRLPRLPHPRPTAPPTCSCPCQACSPSYCPATAGVSAQHR